MRHVRGYGPEERSAPWSIRAYRPADYRRVVGLWQRAGLISSPSDRREELERSRRRDPDLFLVAESRKGIVGVVLGRFDGRRGWINHLAVDSDYRRRGLGRELMERVERRLLRKGCAKVNLHIEPGNRGVVEFYVRLGYRERELLFMDKWIRPG
jgi:ribosomal protein S18 acetylase RimI-like enzyme